MRKTLIPGMFSSVSDAELATEMMDPSNLDNNQELANKSTTNSDDKVLPDSSERAY